MLSVGGFRIGKIGTLRWGQLTFDDNSSVANVTFKTNTPRYFRLALIYEYLARWQAGYPGDPAGTTQVFLNRSGIPLQHPTVARRHPVIARDAGITRHITPHLSRHMRITRTGRIRAA